MLAKALQGASNAAEKIYIESVFSTYLYTGNGSTQTITNGIDLSGKGGLVWIKGRQTAFSHIFVDTTRGATKFLSSNNTTSEQTAPGTVPSFSSTGFTAGTDNQVNLPGDNFASWTFRKAAKFFDVVTYTGDGNGSTPRVISHNLGSVPGVIIIKTLGASSDWLVYHRSLGPDKNLRLNSTAAAQTNTSFPWQNTSPTSTTFTVDPTDGWTNGGGQTYVAYLFAHDAGGFGDSGNDNVISCGSYTGNGSASGPTINLGWEPQWLVVKRASGGTGGWEMIDNMRGFVAGGNDAILYADLSNAEAASDRVSPTGTGFQVTTSSTALNNNGDTYIYIAIRRGPMKTPTDATKVFEAKKNITSSSPFSLTGPPYVDFIIDKRNELAGDPTAETRLLGATRLFTNLTNSESAGSANWGGATGTQNITPYNTGDNHVAYLFRRAPGFFDVVAYTGTGSAQTVNHNLGAVPELIITKSRNNPQGWFSMANITATTFADLRIDLTSAATSRSYADNAGLSAAPTSSVLYLDGSSRTNASTYTYIAYLFATLAGISKVGSYTGTGTTQQINCGFTAGARFVLIKRTDSTGDWFVYDTARGIVSGNDSYLLLNSTAAEVTNTDYIDPLNSGFEISSTAPAAINANGGSFIYLAIA